MAKSRRRPGNKPMRVPNPDWIPVSRGGKRM